jgi:GT2 family glycosyltransferase/glycosyltransferase involved in cell wall biosynthesis
MADGSIRAERRARPNTTTNPTNDHVFASGASADVPEEQAAPVTAHDEGFIEELYLALNPDVAEAVRRGKFASGRHHWLQSGCTETENGLRPALQRESFYQAPPQKPATNEAESWYLDTGAYLYLNPDVRGAIGDDAQAAREHWVNHGRFEARKSPGIAPFRRRQINFARMGAKPFGMNVFGPFMAKSGLGTACRNMLAAIKLTQLPFEVWNFDTSNGPPRVAEVDKLRRPRFNTNIIFANADQIERVFLEYPEGFFDNAYTIAIWQWELAAFRSDWFSAFGAVDEVWTNSRFQVESIRSIAPVPVIQIHLPVITTPADTPMSRADYGIADDAYVFLLPFDLGSTIARKNPLAGIAAFREAYAGREDFVLIVKYHAPEHNAQFVQQLRTAIGGASNIRVLSETLSHTDMARLRAMSDCLLAPHRSEGFGLNIAEFMALGKPVIATNYAGNVDFLDTTTGYPVDYTLTEIDQMTGPYPTGFVWAEPRHSSLVKQLRDVGQNPKEAARRAAAAAKRMADDFSPARIAWQIIAHLRKTEIDRPLPAYARWIGQSTAIRTPSPFGRFADQGGAAPPPHHVTPMFSIVMPVYNVESALLERSIQSVIDQTYPFWELCIANDASTAPDTLATLNKYRGVSSRIKIVDLHANAGIAGASNRAASIAVGDYIALLDNDDELEPQALWEIATAINENPALDCIYTDETKIDKDGVEIEHFYKPDWSPEHLESVMYVLHMLVVRKRLFFAAGQFRPEYDGAQDYDLMLRLSRMTDKIGHVPKALYKWRAIPGSSAMIVDAKPTALDSGLRALKDHVAQKFGQAATAGPGLLMGTFRVRRNVNVKPPVSLMILTNNGTADLPGRGKVRMVDNFIRSITELTAYPNFRIVVVDNSSLSKQQLKKFEDEKIQVVNHDRPGKFNFAAKANFAARAARTELMVLLNDDMEVINPDWLGALIEYAQDPEIGAVGARLLHADGSIQHVGAVLGVNDSVAHIYHQAPREFVGYNGFTHIVRNYSAVTGACLATRKSVLTHAGGFDESFAVDFNDIDLCLKIRQAGYRIVYTPYSELYHFEGRSIVRTTQSEDERQRFCQRWSDVLARDPFYNVNLSRNRLDFARAE